MPDLPELSAADTPHGQGPRAAAGHTSPLCDQSGHQAALPLVLGTSKKGAAGGERRDEDTPACPKSEEEETSLWTSHSCQGRAQGGGDLGTFSLVVAEGD